MRVVWIETKTFPKMKITEKGDKYLLMNQQCKTNRSNSLRRLPGWKKWTQSLLFSFVQTLLYRLGLRQYSEAKVQILLIPLSGGLWWYFGLALPDTSHPPKQSHLILHEGMDPLHNEQKYHHSLKEHHKISKIPKFRCEML